MDRIVILTNSLERGGKLESSLRMLFPACQIEMQLAKMERDGDVSGKDDRGAMLENMELALSSR